MHSHAEENAKRTSISALNLVQMHAPELEPSPERQVTKWRALAPQPWGFQMTRGMNSIALRCSNKNRLPFPIWTGTARTGGPIVFISDSRATQSWALPRRGRRGEIPQRHLGIVTSTAFRTGSATEPMAGCAFGQKCGPTQSPQVCLSQQGAITCRTDHLA